jgi:ubiquinone/menaquinone biosynthesis C-methylase UbiE
VEPEEYEKTYTLEDFHWWFVGRRSLAEALLAHSAYPISGPVLDVGCGTGGNLKFLTRYGWAVGIDLCSQALCHCHERGLDTIAQASVMQLPFADNVFGTITSFDVLYHEEVRDDLAALREFYRVCRSGGSLLITDSALPFLRSQHDVAYHGARRYMAGELRAKVETAGFYPIKVSYSNAFVFPLIAAVRLMRRLTRWQPFGDGSDLRQQSPLVNSILTMVYQCEASLQPWISFPLGSSVVCLARKP